MRGSRRLLTVLIAVIGVLALVALLRDSAQEPPEVVPGEASTAAPVVAHTGGAELGTTEATSLDARTERTSAAEIEEEDDETDDGRLRVQVVDERGAPVFGIPVGLVARVVGQPAAKVMTDEETEEPDGVARLHLPDLSRASALELELVAAILLPLEPGVSRVVSGAPSTDVVRLVLPDGAAVWCEKLVVEVVDDAGDPVEDAAVELRSIRRDEPETVDRLDREETDAAGRAYLDRDEQVEALLVGRHLGLQYDFEVACTGPWAEEPRLALAAEPRRGEVLRIALPRSGAVEVEVRDASNRLVTVGAGVQVSCRPAGLEHSFRRSGRGRLPVVDGLARFERIGLGLDLRLWASSDGNDAEPAQVDARGPVAPGEVVRIVLRLGAPRPWIVGRILDDAGQPRPNLRFGFLSDLWDAPARVPRNGPRQRSPARHQTDAEGRFRIVWTAARAWQGRLFAEVEERADPRGAPAGWIAGYARADLPNPLEGEVDLGDLVLEDTPILVAGRVVDTAGAPVRHAWLSIRWPQGEGAAARWFNLNVPRQRTDDDGRFEVRSLHRVRELGLHASHRDYGPSPEVRVPPGSLDATVILPPQQPPPPPAGTIVGSLLVDEGIAHDRLEVRLRRQGGGGTHTETPYFSGFHFDRLAAGTYELELRLEKTRWTVARVQGLVARAGEETLDPRVNPLDLRGKLRLLRLQLVGPDGRGLVSRWVHFEVDGRGGQLRTDKRGRVVVVMRAADPTVDVGAAGFRPVVTGWSPVEQRILLEPDPDDG